MFIQRLVINFEVMLDKSMVETLSVHLKNAGPASQNSQFMKEVSTENKQPLKTPNTLPLFLFTMTCELR